MIPIRNLYHLFCYAWAYYRPSRETEVGVDESPDIPHLLSRMLLNGTNRLIRRGFDRRYSVRREEQALPRGHLLIDDSIKKMSKLRGNLWCEYDELTRDVLHNQIIKATAAKLVRHSSVGRVMAEELRALLRKLVDISDIRLSGELFRQIQLSRQSAQYGALMRLCEFVCRSDLPTTQGKEARSWGINTDDVKMSSVFEEFLRNFYRFEQAEFRVAREDMRWAVSAEVGSDLSLMPLMRTDMTLRSGRRALVIDAKYYSDPFPVNSGVRKMRSGHIYQLYAYLKHLRQQSGDQAVEGAIVYAAPNGGSRNRYLIDGHRVTIAAIDLSLPWQSIHRDLLAVVDGS